MNEQMNESVAPGIVLFSENFWPFFAIKSVGRTDRPTVGRTNWQMDGPTDRWTDQLTYGQTNRRTDRPSYRDALTHLKGFPIFTLFYVLGLLHNQDSNCTTSKIDPLLLPWAKTSFIGKKNFFSRDPTSQRVGKANGPALILMHGRQNAWFI